jgi:hypothetical protein
MHPVCMSTYGVRGRGVRCVIKLQVFRGAYSSSVSPTPTGLRFAACAGSSTSFSLGIASTIRPGYSAAARATRLSR